MLRPISLWPFPEAAFQQVLSGTKRFLVVEANNGQMVEDVRLAVCGKAEVIHYGVGGGHILNPDEIYGEIVRVYKMK
jgi:2-oxoglutarate ferredoxin oxidoreductase subunit alpha